MPVHLGNDPFILTAVSARRRAKKEDEAKRRKEKARKEAAAKKEKSRRRRKPTKVEHLRTAMSAPQDKPRSMTTPEEAEHRKKRSQINEPVSPAARAVKKGEQSKARLEAAGVPVKQLSHSEQASHIQAATQRERSGDETKAHDLMQPDKLTVADLKGRKELEEQRVDFSGLLKPSAAGTLAAVEGESRTVNHRAMAEELAGAPPEQHTSMLQQLENKIGFELLPEAPGINSQGGLDVEFPMFSGLNDVPWLEEAAVAGTIGKTMLVLGSSAVMPNVAKAMKGEDFNEYWAAVELLAFGGTNVTVPGRAAAATVFGAKAVAKGGGVSAGKAAAIEQMRTTAPLTMVALRLAGRSTSRIGRTTQTIGNLTYNKLGELSVQAAQSSAPGAGAAAALLRPFRKAVAKGAKPFRETERDAKLIRQGELTEERFGFGYQLFIRREAPKLALDIDRAAVGIVHEGLTPATRIAAIDRWIDGLEIVGKHMGRPLLKREQEIMNRLSDLRSELRRLTPVIVPDAKNYSFGRPLPTAEAVTAAKAPTKRQVELERLIEGEEALLATRAPLNRRSETVEAWIEERVLALRGEQDLVRLAADEWIDVVNGLPVLRPMKASKARGLPGLPQITVLGLGGRRHTSTNVSRGTRRRKIEQLIEASAWVAQNTQQRLIDSGVLLADIAENRLIAQAELAFGRTLHEGERIPGHFVSDAVNMTDEGAEFLDILHQGTSSAKDLSPVLDPSSPVFKSWYGTNRINGYVTVANTPEVVGRHGMSMSQLVARHIAYKKAALISRSKPLHKTDVPIRTGAPPDAKMAEVIRETEAAGKATGEKLRYSDMNEIGDDIVDGIYEWRFPSGTTAAGDLDEIGRILEKLENGTLAVEDVGEVAGIGWLSQTEMGQIAWRGLPNLAKARRGVAGLTAAGQIPQAINAVARFMILPGSGAYVPMNLGGNTLLNFIQQGFLMPKRLAQASRLNMQSSKAFILELDAISGEGLTNALMALQLGPPMTAVDRLQKFIAALARPILNLTDVVSRRASVLHEMTREMSKQTGIRTKDIKTRDLEAWWKKTDAPTRERVATLGKDAIVNFDKMNPMEKIVGQQWLFFYPWFKASVPVTKKLLQNHPAQMATLAYVGNETREYRNKKLGKLKPWQDLLVHGTEVRNPLRYFPFLPDEWKSGSLEYNLGYQKGDMGYGVDSEGQSLDKNGDLMPRVVNLTQPLGPMATVYEITSFLATQNPDELRQTVGRLLPFWNQAIEAGTLRDTFFGSELDPALPGRLGQLELMIRPLFEEAPGVKRIRDVIDQPRQTFRFNTRTPTQQKITAGTGSIGPSGLNLAEIRESNVDELPLEERQQAGRVAAVEVVDEFLPEGRKTQYLEAYDRSLAWDLEISTLEKEVKDEYEVRTLSDDDDARAEYNEGKLQFLLDMTEETKGRSDSVNNLRRRLVTGEMDEDEVEDRIDHFRDKLFSTILGKLDRSIAKRNDGDDPRDVD